jgi:hypothetical protein
MSSPEELDPLRRYPPELRVALVDWAYRAGPAGLAPPELVREHLERTFAEAGRAGRARGLRRAAPVLVLAVALIVAAMLWPGAR